MARVKGEGSAYTTCNAVSAVQCSAVQCSAVQCSAVQCSAVKCSVVQCSAVQCSLVKFGTLCILGQSEQGSLLDMLHLHLRHSILSTKDLKYPLNRNYNIIKKYFISTL